MIAAQPVQARPRPARDQVVELIADHGYRPRSIVAKAGVPLRLIVHRQDDETCMDRIVFSSPRLDRQLARGTTTTIVLPAQPPGEIRFTCGMGRYQGRIVLRPETPSSVSALRTGIAFWLRRGWLLLRSAGKPPVEQGAQAILRRRVASGEISEAEFTRRRDPRTRTSRETAS